MENILTLKIMFIVFTKYIINYIKIKYVSTSIVGFHSMRQRNHLFEEVFQECRKNVVISLGQLVELLKVQTIIGIGVIHSENVNKHAICQFIVISST